MLSTCVLPLRSRPAFLSLLLGIVLPLCGQPPRPRPPKPVPPTSQLPPKTQRRAPGAAQLTPDPSWTRQFGTTQFDQANAVGYGEFGIYTAGETLGDFKGYTNAGGKDAFISLHDEEGNLKWVRQFGTQEEDVATGVAPNGAGAYVVGYTRGALGAQIGGSDSFIRMYDPNGNVLWSRQFGTTADDFATGVATHTSGVYVVGYVDCCNSTFPGVPLTVQADGYLMKFDGNGNVLWTRLISTIEVDQGLGIAIDDSGVYVVGTTWGNLAGPQGQRDGFLRKYGHDGSTQWTKQIGTFLPSGDAAVDDLYAVAVGPSGVYVAGATSQGALPGATFAGGQWDAFVARFDPAGNPVWSKQIGTDGDDFAYGISLGGDHILVVGGTSGNLVSGAYTGGEDAFLRFYDLDGNVLGTQEFGGGLNDSGRGVIAYKGGHLVSGTKNGTALGTLSIGDNDAFVMRIAPPPPVVQPVK